MAIRSTVTKQSNMILYFFFLIALSVCLYYVFLNLSIYRIVYAVHMNCHNSKFILIQTFSL